MIWKESAGSWRGNPEEPAWIEVFHLRDSAGGWELIWFRKADRRPGWRVDGLEGWASGREQNRSGESLIKQEQVRGTSTPVSNAPPAGRWVEVFSFLAIGAFVLLWVFWWR